MDLNDFYQNIQSYMYFKLKIAPVPVIKCG